MRPGKHLAGGLQLGYTVNLAGVQYKIKGLEEKKATLLAPKPARQTRKPHMTKKMKMEAILKQAQKAGKTSDELEVPQ